MGGVGSPGFELFKQLFKEGFEAARKHSDEIISACLAELDSPLRGTTDPALVLSEQPLSSSCSTVSRLCPSQSLFFD